MTGVLGDSISYLGVGSLGILRFYGALAIDVRCAGFKLDGTSSQICGFRNC